MTLSSGYLTNYIGFIFQGKKPDNKAKLTAHTEENLSSCTSAEKSGHKPRKRKKDKVRKTKTYDLRRSLSQQTINGTAESNDFNTPRKSIDRFSDIQSVVLANQARLREKFKTPKNSNYNPSQTGRNRSRSQAKLSPTRYL